LSYAIDILIFYFFTGFLRWRIMKVWWISVCSSYFSGRRWKIVMEKTKEMNKFLANVKITPVNELTFLNFNFFLGKIFYFFKQKIISWNGTLQRACTWVTLWLVTLMILVNHNVTSDFFLSLTWSFFFVHLRHCG